MGAISYLINQAIIMLAKRRGYIDPADMIMGAMSVYVILVMNISCFVGVFEYFHLIELQSKTVFMYLIIPVVGFQLLYFLYVSGPKRYKLERKAKVIARKETMRGQVIIRAYYFVSVTLFVCCVSQLWDFR